MIVFLTVYLGLIAGRQPFELRADPAVRAIRLLLDGHEVATLRQPPWKTEVDLGVPLLPHEIVAVGLDAKGNEIARASQIINVPHARAEVTMIVHRNPQGRPTDIEVEARHAKYFQPTRVSVHLDSVPLRLDRHRYAGLPAVDMKRPHVLSVEAAFSDGAVARREIVFGGEFGEAVPTELTPVAVIPASAQPGAAAGCFALRVSSVEKPPADLFVVRDPNPSEARRALKAPLFFRGDARHAAPVDATMELVSAVPETIRGEDHPTTFLFPRVVNRQRDDGLYAFVTSARVPGLDEGPPRWADAVAVAAVKAIADGRRRAIVLILGSAPDASRHSPASVRNYLDSIGVPLFVWSVIGPRPDLTASWGEVVDVSSREKLERAAEDVNRALDEQRIVWLYASPIAALHAQVREGCGWRRLGQ